MSGRWKFMARAWRVIALPVLAVSPCFAVATLTQEIESRTTNVGDPVMVTLTVQGGTIGRIQLPKVDGLEAGDPSYQIKSIEDNGSFFTTVSFSIAITPTRPGDFTIPAFDLRTQEGDVLHVKAIKLHVPGNGWVAGAITNPASTSSTDAAANLNGPVIMPPTNAAPTPGVPDNGNATNNPGAVAPPRDPSGGPAKVFIIITPETTDAYVGQAVPMRIDFFIRLDVNAEQDSLPTIKGSDFLMNSFTHRGQESTGLVENEEYGRETWMTAISAPRSGDFPLSMERDTYWVKSVTSNNLDPFGGFFSRHADLAHESISSNQFTMHIHPLPEEGRPAHFTGAIGQFQVTGDARPASVAMGEPVELNFTVSGEGNFDYVRCPALTDDPDWKTYVPATKTTYRDESHIQAAKIFKQSVIAQKSGAVPLPAASFSYFDPTATQYITVPIALPVITITGSPAPLASSPVEDISNSTSEARPPVADEFLPNRTEIGSTRMTLVPVYRQPWFWAIQAGLAALLLLGALLVFIRSRTSSNDNRAELARRQRSLQQEEEAMADAVRTGNARAFFVAARHAIQLQLGARWNVNAEALTFGEIRSRDPQLAETLAPLFAQADEVIYSGRASSGHNLAEWENRVRTELLDPQTA